ncbi:hypothetical protein [Streptomyces sp. NPDC020742]|uniref:hypothetical protein n=1 Tax=Streptomyces sp. NPDC020742 TaxID=3154897 RepID=UPI0033E6660F
MTQKPNFEAQPDQARPVPSPPAHPPSIMFTAGDGAMMAGRDITNPVSGPSIGGDNSGTVAGRDINTTTHHTTKKGGRGHWWIAIVILLAAGTGGGVYWATQGDGDSVSEIGAQPGEAGVRDAWAATSEALRKGDGETLCALMTVDSRAKLEQSTPGTCAEAVDELFASSESSTLNDAGSGRLQKVTVRGRWAELAEAGQSAGEPSYSYMERFGDRWRWTHRVLFSEFHPDECPGVNSYNFASQDPRCSQTSILPSSTSGQ